jgi:glycosyltransferase involved in cell wall biosynthesis
MKPAVSVAIATYNRAAMVRQAVEAALGQTLPPLEVCVADDASTDATWPALKALAAADPRVRIFRHSKNTGGVENWNFVIRQTHGAYIAWCSDDDRFLPQHLERAVAYLEAHPGIGLVHAGFVDAIETPEGCRRCERPLRFAQDTVLDRGGLLRYLTRYYDWPFHPSTLVMRRAVWEAVGPFDPAFALADTDWFIRAVEAGPVAMLAHHGVLNRRHPGNWSNRLGSARMQGEIRAIVERAIDRRFVASPLSRAAWKAIWRMNVRARLLLTVKARLDSGHADAACAAWFQAVEGAWIPGSAARAGAWLLRRACARRVPVFEDARQSVSPL